MSPRARILALLVLSLGFRTAVLLTLERPEMLQLHRLQANSDMAATWQWAGRIAAGDLLGRDPYHPRFAWMGRIAPQETFHTWWGGREVFHQAPLYAYFVAGARALLPAGTEALGVVLLQLALGALHPLLLYAVGRRVFGEGAAFAGAALLACTAPLAFYQSVLLRDWLVAWLETLALLAAVCAAQDARPRNLLAAGAAFGLAVLCKPTSLLFALAAAATLALWQPRARRAVAVAWLAGGIALPLAPLVARNLAVGAPPLALSTRAVDGIVQGNAADGDPVGMIVPASYAATLRRSEGRVVPAVVAVLEGYRDDPAQLLAQQLRKLRGLLGRYEVPNNVSFDYAAQLSPPLRHAPGFGWLLPLGLVGMALAQGRRREHRLVLLLAGTALLGLCAAVALGRYRLVLVPPLCLYAGHTLVAFGRALRRRHRATAAGIAAAVAACALAQGALALPGVERRALPSPDQQTLIRTLAQSGRIAAARAELQRLAAHADALGADAALRRRIAEIARAVDAQAGEPGTATNPHDGSR